jgi:cytochrome c oxidase subunit II
MRQRRPRLPHQWPVGVLAAGLAAFACSQPVLAASGLDPIVPAGESPNGQAIHWLYLFISPFALAIFFLVEVLLLVIILRHRRSKQPSDYRPPQWHGNTRLEIVWTTVPILILAVVAYFSFQTLQQYFVKPSDAATNLNVVITGHQFGWVYDYPGGVEVKSEGVGAADNPLVIPAGQLVRIELRSIDVIHGFWVPDLTGKTDAVPGYANFTWFKVDHTGEWRGQCTELCGVGHATMQIRVKAVSSSDFQTWLAEQPKTASPVATSSPGPPALPNPPSSM